MERRIVLCAFLTVCGIVNAQIQPIEPPIVEVTNTGNELNNDVTMHKKYSVTVRKFSQSSYKVPVTSTDVRTTSSAVKRDVLTNKVDDFPTLSSDFDEDLLHREEVENCAFSFTLPNPLPRNQQICVKKLDPIPPQAADDITLSLLQDRVLGTQQSVEDLRSEVEEYLSDADLEPMNNAIRLLQKESRNMNFRVSQLYMQLLHEIIRKRDGTIEYTSMENNVLNVTVKYYELKEKHEALFLDHERLTSVTGAQQEQIEHLQEKVEEMMNKINRISANAEQVANDAPVIVEVQRENVTRTNHHSHVTYTDCVDLQRVGTSESGQYHLKLQSMTKKMRVWCDFEQDPGGWIVIQRRSNKRVNFYRNMVSYQRGFGLLDGDFWLGLDHIHLLTNQDGKNYKLHVDMEDWNGRKTFVEYGSFKVGGADDGYRLKISHYSGTAGDSLTWHNNMKFTAKNEDNDLFVRNCANYQKGGWWYNQCAHSNLNGVYYEGGHYMSKYQDGVYWSEWRGGSYSLKKVEMKIRPTE